MRRSTKWDWDSQPFGRVPDARIAERLGCSTATVCKQRQLRGIASCQKHRKFVRRSLTLGTRCSKTELERLRAEEYPEGIERPRCRADCVNAERPCPFASCKHHLYVDVEPSGSLKINFPRKELWELEETCALDVAARGGETLEEIGQLLQITRERVRQTEKKFLERLKSRPAIKRAARELGIKKAA